MVQDIKNAFLEKFPITNKSQPLLCVCKRSLVVIVYALWKMQELKSEFKNTTGESGRQDVKNIKALGLGRNISSAFLGVALGHLLFLDCYFPNIGQSLPQVSHLGQCAHLGHYCTGGSFT